MISFKQFLNEMPLRISDHTKDDNQIGPSDHKELHPAFKGSPNYKKISSIKGLDIWHDRPNGRFNVVDKEGNTKMALDGAFDREEGRKHFSINDLRGHPSSPVKAHEFYHHLITQHGIILHGSSEQSDGGMKVWKKLSENPDIHVSHLDAHNEEIPLHRGDDFEKNYSTYMDHRSLSGMSHTHFMARKKS